MKSFSNAKSIDYNREVRQAADQCYDLLTDLSRLFLRRRRVAYAKAHQSTEAPKTSKTWSDYLVGRLPFTMDARQLHALFRPEGVGVGVTYFEPNVALNHSINANGLNTSLLALERLDGSLRNSRFGSQLMFDDEMEQYQDLGDDPDNLATNSRSSGHMNEAHYQEQYDEVEKEYNDAHLPKEKTLNEFDDEDFLKAFDSSFPGNSDHDSASLLQSFNNAASSHSGSYFSSNHSGSYFSSDHTGSYFSASGDEDQSSKPRKSRGVKKKSSGVGIQDQLRGFVFPEDEGGQGVIHEHDNESESRSNMSSYQDEGKSCV